MPTQKPRSTNVRTSIAYFFLGDWYTNQSDDEDDKNSVLPRFFV